MKKIYYTYEKVHKLIEKIANEIKNDQWSPDCIIAISAGGLVPARIMRNYLEKDIYIVGIKRYINDALTHDVIIKIQWLDEVEKKVKDKKILLIDEIDDTRVTLSYCLKELLKQQPKEIRVAVINKKLKKKEANFPEEVKKCYVGEEVEDVWVNYPWEAINIDEHYKLCFNK